MNSRSTPWTHEDPAGSLWLGQERFRGAFLHSGIGMALVSTEGQFLDVNPTLCDFLGYEEEELLTHDFQSLTHPEDLSRDLDCLEKMLAGEIETYAIEKRYRHKEGHYLWGMLTVSLIRGEDGSPLFFLSQIQDVTARRKNVEALARARDEAEEADRAKGNFLATMSHEIRTPMNAVLGFASLLRSTPLNEDQKEYVQIIESSGERLLGLISDVLDFAKIESGTISVQPAPMNVRRCVDEVFLLMRPTAEAKRLTYDLVVDPGVPEGCVSDASRLTQILVNLLGNAIKFTEKGAVTLRVAAAVGESGTADWEFRVTDNGPGIPAGMEEEIFQLFFQGNGAHPDHQEGSGLGLAISRRLAELLDGRIEVRNVPSGGAEFCLHLNAPMAEVPQTSPARE